MVLYTTMQGPVWVILGETAEAEALEFTSAVMYGN